MALIYLIVEPKGKSAMSYKLLCFPVNTSIIDSSWNQNLSTVLYFFKQIKNTIYFGLWVLLVAKALAILLGVFFQDLALVHAHIFKQLNTVVFWLWTMIPSIHVEKGKMLPCVQPTIHLWRDPTAVYRSLPYFTIVYRVLKLLVMNLDKPRCDIWCDPNFAIWGG